MQRILKYRLEPETEIKVSAGFKPLHVQEVGGEIYLWAENNDAASQLYDVKIQAVGTGGVAPGADWIFIGTVVMFDGMVFHFYYNRF